VHLANDLIPFQSLVETRGQRTLLIAGKRVPIESRVRVMTAKIAVITFVSVCCADASRAQAVESGNGLKLRENTFQYMVEMGISIADAPDLLVS